MTCFRDEREEENLMTELGPRVWMWLEAENDHSLGFSLPEMWFHMKPHGSEF